MIRSPDVCFIVAGRLPEEDYSRGFTELVPDLIIEIASPDARPGAIRSKTQLWLAAGARLVWNLYPESRTIVISQPGQPDRTLQEGDVLSGEPVLAEFSVPVAAFFT